MTILDDDKEKIVQYQSHTDFGFQALSKVEDLRDHYVIEKYDNDDFDSLEQGTDTKPKMEKCNDTAFESEFREKLDSLLAKREKTNYTLNLELEKKQKTLEPEVHFLDEALAQAINQNGFKEIYGEQSKKSKNTVKKTLAEVGYKPK